MRRFPLLPFALLAAASAAVAAAPADDFVTTASGLKYRITAHGPGPLARPGEVLLVRYTGTLPDGKVFDQSGADAPPFAFTLGKQQVIKGWDEAFALLHGGDKATLVIPPELAYGDRAVGPIPAKATLRFDVELVGVKEHGLADELRATIDRSGLEAAGKRYEELKAAHFGDYYVSEGQLNELGYHYLQHQKTPEALAVLRWNVELFPQSANVYDSLGEACVQAGDRAGSIANYARSFELDPKNRNAERMLAELRATPDQPGALAAMQERMRLGDELDSASDDWEAGRGVDVPALRAKIDAFLARYPDSNAAAAFVSNFFYLVESIDLKLAVEQWRAFAASPNARVRALAEQKLKLVPLMTQPMELSFKAVDGRDVDVAKLRGKVVLIDFWATWCGPCVHEIPNVVAVYGKYHAQGFDIVGISFDRAPDPAHPWPAARTAQGVEMFTAEHGMPWPQYYDGTYWDNPIGRRFDIRGIPAMFLLDKEGRLISTNARGPKLESEVRRLLAL